LLFDRDAKFDADVVSAVRDMGSEPTRTAFACPWQNAVAERWVGSCRRDLLDHVIILNKRHLKRLLSSYLLYYHEDRTHLGLAKEVVQQKFALRVKARFNPFRDSAGCTIAIRWQRRLKGNSSEDKTLLAATAGGAAHVFCEHLSSIHNQPTISNRRGSAKQKEVRFVSVKTIWRSTAWS
jgi:hypothetical protein